MRLVRFTSDEGRQRIEQRREAAVASLALAHAAGVAICAGLEPWQALAAATWRGSDFLLVHGDPLSDPASPWRTWRVSQ